MTNLNSINQNSIYDKIYKKHNSYSEDRKHLSNKKDKEDSAISTNAKESEKNTFLSNSEKNTLHMFFGSKKPEEMQFYGNNKVDRIHKGKFLDLKG